MKNSIGKIVRKITHIWPEAMDIVNPGRLSPGVTDHLRVQPRRWLHRLPVMTAKIQIHEKEIQPPPGLNAWVYSSPRAQVPAANKMHGLRPYKIYRNALQSDKMKATRARRGLNVVSRELRSDRRERHTRGRSDTNVSTCRMAGCTTPTAADYKESCNPPFGRLMLFTEPTADTALRALIRG